MALTKEARDALPSSSFAVPGKRALPIHDAVHVRMAWRQVDRTHGLSDSERKTARERILHKANELGIDTGDWQAVAAMSFSAMAIIMPVVDDHPNRMPFSGVLTRVDEPSDNAPMGSNGKLVMLPRAVAERALSSLLGMAVDFEAGFVGHDPQMKIGVITAATIEGSAIHIEGFIYASDFPEEAAAIQTNKDKLGFSFEAKRILVETLDADPLVITECVFTGAAILRKDKAAYMTTSLAASADQSKVKPMDPELKALLEGFAAKLETVSTSVAKLQAASDINAGTEHTRAAVETHASALESCATSMEAAGIGNDPQNGHSVKLRKMAGAMRAEAAMGKIPHVYRDHDYGYSAAADKARSEADAATAKAALEAATKPLLDQVAAMGTQLADLKAKAFKDSPAPDRKTLPPAITAILAKSGIVEPTEGSKLDPKAVSKALKDSGMDNNGIMTAKTALARAGLMD